MRMIRTPAVVLALGLVAGATACSESRDDGRPVRVAELPAGVTGLGPAVFLAAVDHERRDDRFGLVAVERFGDDIAGVAPVRRHIDLAEGDPLQPTVARGLRDDPRDARLTGGRVHDADLPEQIRPRAVTTVRDGLTVTERECLIVRTDGIRPPAADARCAPGDSGGLLWTDARTGRHGGVDLDTGTPSPAVAVPGRPIAATADGRRLVAEEENTRHLVLADTATGAVVRTRVVRPRAADPQTMTGKRYAFVRQADRVRRLSVLGFDGTVRDLLAPVGAVAFTPDGTTAVTAVTRGGVPELVILDLDTGATRRPAGEAGPRSVAAIVTTDRHALVTDVTPGDGRTSGPVALWTLELGTGRLAPAPATFTAATVRADRGALVFGPGGERITLSADGRAVAVPADAVTPLPLPGGRVLHRLTAGTIRSDLLVLTGADGHRAEIATGATGSQAITHLIPTPDGAHLLVSLRGSPGPAATGADDQVVLVRLDGTGEPVVLYRGVALASLGLSG